MSSPLFAEAGCRTWDRLFCCWSLLRNNKMATNLQRLISSFSSKRFVAYDCWTQTSSLVMQRDSDCWYRAGAQSVQVSWKSRPNQFLMISRHAGAELGGCQGGPLPPQNFAWPSQWPPQNFSGLFLKVLHRPLAAPLVAKLAPPVAPPNENVWLRPWRHVPKLPVQGTGDLPCVGDLFGQNPKRVTSGGCGHEWYLTVPPKLS